MAALPVIVGCTASTQTAPGQQGQSAEPTNAELIFEGTPAEYTTLLRACLEDGGLTTADDLTGDKTGFMIQAGDDEERRVIVDGCKVELGEPKMSGLSEAELRERYDARVEQHACLVDEGLVDGAPVSFETFVDDYERSGQKVLWEPTLTASDAPDGSGGASVVCPRDPGVW